METNPIMAKTFFAVVPYESIDISKAGGDLLATLKFWEKKKNGEKDDGLEQKITQLNQRTDIAINGLNQVGLRAVALNDEELIELFYNLYNPETVEKKELKIAHGEN